MSVNLSSRPSPEARVKPIVQDEQELSLDASKDSSLDFPDVGNGRNWTRLNSTWTT